MKNVRTEFQIFVVLTIATLVASTYWMITKQHADTANTIVYIATAQMIRLIVVTRRSAKRIVERIADVQAVDCPDCQIKPQS